jgi:hypothetical protein
MKYTTAAAFRAALEDRLKSPATLAQQGLLVRRRRLMVFDRLIARLLVVAPDRWILKGAVARDWRFGNQARATKDLDLAARENEAVATVDLQMAQTVDVDDYFRFDVQRTSALDVLTEGSAVRYRVRATLAGRRFEEFVLDVGFAGLSQAPPDLLRGPEFFAFAGIPPAEAPTLSLGQHVAEKLHAYTRVFADGKRSSRTKDLVDLVLIQSLSPFDAGTLLAAIKRTFAARPNHDWPRFVSLPPDDWVTAYERMAGEIGVESDLHSAHLLVAAFLDPVLANTLSPPRGGHP